MLRHTCAVLFALLILPFVSHAAPLLLLHPSLSKDQIAFRHADDIWVVARTGGEAIRLTSTASVVNGPYFSPDGQTLAYSARMHGNVDVYTVSANGGVSRRLTYHPDPDVVVGWTPDGKDILFLSGRTSWNDFSKLFRIHADGSGLPVELPLPSVDSASLSPTANSSPTRPSISGSPPGSVITAAKRNPSGSSTSPASTSPRFHATIPTTPILSGLGTKFTSSPIATAPSRSSATTPNPSRSSRSSRTGVSI